LLPALYILLESFGDSGFLCPVSSNLLSFKYQLVVDRKIRRHHATSTQNITHTGV
jgi:hypothetical protein